MQQNLFTEYDFLANPVTLVVMAWLLLYLFFVFLTFFYRYFKLHSWQKRENESLNGMLLGSTIQINSSLSNCLEKSDSHKEIALNACIEAAKKEGKKGLTFLAIVSSTAPFIGLFGTVVSILTAFSGFSDDASLGMVAPAISEALIVTAIGIVTAVPAYSFHQILANKFETVLSILKIERDFFISDDK